MEYGTFDPNDTPKEVGPKSTVRLLYSHPDFRVDITITPFEGYQMGINLVGNLPVEPNIPPPGNNALAVDGLRHCFEVLEFIIEDVCPAQYTAGYILTPGYVPDGDHNERVYIYPCGKPRGSHFHTFGMEPGTNEVSKEEMKTQLGDHSQKSLAKILYGRLKHLWPEKPTLTKWAW